MKLATLDFGKTNSKVLVFDGDGEIIHSARTQPHWRMADGFRVLDDGALHAWAVHELEQIHRKNSLDGVMVSAHGCTFALAGEAGLVRPILDYEQEIPANLAEHVDAQLPDYAETFAPPRPLGFNYGRHMVWLRDVEPASFERTSAILGYPQFWSWRLGGAPASEYSYLGCHSHLWAPLKRDFSSLVDKCGWRSKMPPLARAGQITGRTAVGGASVAVHNGVHDSNAALYAYRSAGFESFTLVSTGTWVIVFNADCPMQALDGRLDMLANVDVDGRPVPTVGFMGGREFDVLSGGSKSQVDRAAAQRVINRQVLALPSFADAGPFGRMAGRVDGEIHDKAERGALALLYVALMTDLAMDLVRSENQIIVDGGLTAGGVFAELLAQLRTGQSVLQGAHPEGTAAGAAALAFEVHGARLPLPAPTPVAPAGYAGLAAYRERWRALIPPRVQLKSRRSA